MESKRTELHRRSLSRTWGVVLLLGAVASCKSEPAGAPDAAPSPGSDAALNVEADVGTSTRADGGPPPVCAPAVRTVVHLTTADGVPLEADLRPTGVAGGPGAVLLHMIPPSNDRTNYPPAFIEALAARGITVINLDRRGGGGSGGRAQDAYTGPNGKLDAQAAIDLLVAHPCAVDPARIAIVGASNGTTTALDLTVLAGSSGAPRPRALVFLTAGGYTESQNRIADHRALLEPIPILFVYSNAERAYSAALAPGAPATWSFREYDPGDHGTRMFSVQPGAIVAVADFIANALR